MRAYFVRACSWLAGLLLLSASAAGAPAGRFRVVTYNVAGLPEGVSQSHPLANLPLIGERLNRYDLALVQEDFAYAPALREKIRLPYGSRPFVRGERYDFGDGLSAFSRFPFQEPKRTAWARCHGITGSFFDCLTPKGLAVTTVELSAGVLIDVYDVHLDAGYSDGDRAARASQLEQLTKAVNQHSAGRAVLVGGDFNLSSAEHELLREFEQATGLRDACRALACPEPQRIDRLFSRGGLRLKLVPARWTVDTGFVDASGRRLSDHLAVAVDYRWVATD